MADHDQRPNSPIWRQIVGTVWRVEKETWREAALIGLVGGVIGYVVRRDSRALAPVLEAGRGAACRRCGARMEPGGRFCPGHGESKTCGCGRSRDNRRRATAQCQATSASPGGRIALRICSSRFSRV